MARNFSRKVVIYIDGKPVEASLQQLQDRIKQLRNEQAKLTIGTQEYIDKSRELERLNAIFKDQKSAANDIGNSWKSASEKLAGYSNILMGIQSLFQMADAGIGKLKDLVADAAELDDAYADVMKTTGLTRDQVLQLNESFKKMDTRTAREQLNQLAYEAGKLGISSSQQVEQFVSAADKINIALGDVLGDGAMVTITVTVEPDEISAILNAYDTLRAALFFYLKEIDIPQGTLDDLSVLDYHISSLRDGILRQVIQE